MTDPNEDREARLSAEADGAPPTPRWVKLMGVIVVVLLALVAVIHIVGGGLGPGAHMPPGP